MSRARLLDLVCSDWTARAVLRYWRLERRLRRSLGIIKPIRVRPSAQLVGHAMVLGVGFVLVASALSNQADAKAVSASGTAGSLHWSAPLSAAIAPDLRELNRAEKLEVGPSVAPTPVSTPPPAQPIPAAPVSAPAQSFTPPPGSGGSGLAAIYAVWGSSPGLSWALRVANCESHYNPRAVNPSSGASGLFQFMPSTWNANFPGQNIWDPYAQAHAALVFYNEGRQSAWTCR